MRTDQDASPDLTKALFNKPGFRACNLRALVIATIVLSTLLPRGAAAESRTQSKNGVAQQWSVQVEKVDPGAVNLDPSFAAATYENLLEELTKKKQFKQVFRSGDRNSSGMPNLLILKTTVQNFTPGSETRRAVTTFTGATKMKVHVQLFTREGQLVLDRVIEGDVRFIGNNLRATKNLAHNVTAAVNNAALSGIEGHEQHPS